MNRIVKANDHIANYKLWKDAWDDMGGAPPKPAGRGLRLLALLGVGVVMLPVIGGAPKAYWMIAPSVLGGAIVLFAIWRMLRRPKPARKVEAPDLVAICVTTAAFPVPTLTQAFHALPAHCQSILRRHAP